MQNGEKWHNFLENNKKGVKPLEKNILSCDHERDDVENQSRAE